MIQLVLFDMDDVFLQPYNTETFLRRLKVDIKANTYKEWADTNIHTPHYESLVDGSEIISIIKQYTQTQEDDMSVLRAYLDCRGAINIEAIKAIDTCKRNNILTGFFANVNSVLGNDYVELQRILNVDYLFMSYELGVVKPDPNIYNYVEQTTDLYSQEILYFDDKVENLIVPQKLGWLVECVSSRNCESLNDYILGYIEGGY